MVPSDMTESKEQDSSSHSTTYEKATEVAEVELAIRTTGTEEEHKAARVLQQRLRRSMIRKKLQQKPVPDRDVFASREDEIAPIHTTNDPRRHHDRAGHYTTLFANGPEFEGLVEETHQMVA